MNQTLRLLIGFLLAGLVLTGCGDAADQGGGALPEPETREYDRIPDTVQTMTFAMG